MSKSQLKKIYLMYLATTKMPNGQNWDRYIPLFCEPNLTDDERHELWEQHVKAQKSCKLVDKRDAA